MNDHLATLTPLSRAGRIANEIAGDEAFNDYRSRKAANTTRRQDNDLALFGDYLRSTGISELGDFAHDPQAWTGITWGLVAGFARWLLRQGYAMASVNARLSTVKRYASLAASAGTLDRTEYALIAQVKGYSLKDGKNLDEIRRAEGIPTRRTTRRATQAAQHKKAQPVSISTAQAEQLKAQPDTPQGRRDRLIMCLLLDHGLRVGEAAALQVDDIDPEGGWLVFYRPKVYKSQRHQLSPDTLLAARAYFEHDAPDSGSLWRGSRKGKGSTHTKAGDGVLTTQGMSARAITKRVNKLGELIGLNGLSAHDCRHYWATQAARSGTSLDRLKQAGGWSSLEMPERYIDEAAIANEGVKLT